MNKLAFHETKLIGRWDLVNGEMKGDNVCMRIRYLIDNCLEKISISEDGWDKLYKDKFDGRYWELIYPQSEMHGGGPPALINLNIEEAKKKYKF